MIPNDAGRSRSGAVPGWAVDALEVLETRRVVMMRTAVAIVVLGLLGALLTPDRVPAGPVMGMAVGLGAVLVGAAAALAVDAGGTIVAGGRHVRGLGGTILVERLGLDAAAAAVADLIDDAFRSHPAATYSVALVPVGDDPDDTQRFCEAVATALAVRDRRVLVADLWDEVPEPGLAEVAMGQAVLHQTVTFDQELLLARVGAGSDLEVARRSLPNLLGSLPADIEIFLAVASAAVQDVGHLGAVDHVVAVAREQVTRRVDLVRVVDVMEEQAHERFVVLLPPSTPAGPAMPLVPGADSDLVPDTDPADLAGDPLDPAAPSGELGEPTPSDDGDWQALSVEAMDAVEGAGADPTIRLRPVAAAAADPTIRLLPVTPPATVAPPEPVEDPEPVAQPGPPQPVAQPQPEPQPVAEPEPEPEPEPVAQPGPPQPVAQPQPEPEPQPVAEPEPQPVAEPEPEPVPEPGPVFAFTSPNPFVSRVAPPVDLAEEDEEHDDILVMAATMHQFVEDLTLRHDVETR